ncbi:hypothetical protein ACOI9R_33795, partial [Mesorhizobium japonicum]
MLIGVVAALGLALLVLPLAAVLVRALWDRLGSLLGSADVVQALGVSLLTSVTATTISLLLGVPLAIVLARAEAWPAV